MVLIIGNFLVYIFVQKQYTHTIERHSFTYRNQMLELRKKIVRSKTSLSALLAGQGNEGRKISQLLSIFFQEYGPELIQLTLLDSNGVVRWGKESKHLPAAAWLSSFDIRLSTDTRLQQADLDSPAASPIHAIQLPLVFNDHPQGFLRGIFEYTAATRSYLKIAQVTLYITLMASAGIIVWGGLLILLKISHHLSSKQNQMEEYAFSLEQARQQLQRVRKELHISEKLASLGYLTAGIAHEIGNPLAAVLGYVELLQKGKLDHHKTTDILQRIQHEIERIQNIIQELVNFSRPHSMNIRKVDVNQILRKMIGQLPSMKNKQIDVHLQLTEFPLFANVDEHKLYSACMNIVGNSIDAISTAGSIQISTFRRIRESLTMPGGSEVIAIQFSDTGSGISEEILPQIFDPFFTTKEPGQGMGLGLSLCHRIIESFHGEIEIHSTPCIGTDVTIFLPPARNIEDGK